MKIGTTLVALGLVGTALGGLAVIGLRSEAGKPLEDASLTVPVGRIGDEVFYVAFQRNDTSEPWGKAPGWAVRVALVDEVRDSADQVHRTLQVQTDFRQGNSSFDVLGSRRMNTSRAVLIELDLATRSPIRVDFLYRYRDYVADTQLPGARSDVSQSWYGPRFLHTNASDDLNRNPWSHLANVPSTFAVQGTTFTEGSLLAPDALGILEPEIAPRMHGVRIEDLETRVRGGAEVDGALAQDVRTSGCLHMDVAEDDDLFLDYWAGRRRNAPGYGDLVPFLHTLVPRKASPCFQADSWVSPDQPYPVLYEQHVFLEGRLVRQWTAVLAEYRPGREPIPWENPDAAPPVRTGNPDLERGPPSTRHPVDGTGSTISYPLEEALRNLESDPSLVGLAQWRRDHPSHHLVGATLYYGTGECEDKGWVFPVAPESMHAWTFAFGIPSGSYFVAQSLRGDDTPRPVNCELGALRGPPFAEADLPEGAVTLAAMERYWRTQTQRPGLPTNFLQWGGYPDCPEEAENGVGDPTGHVWVFVSACTSELTIELTPDDLRSATIGYWMGLPQVGWDLDFSVFELESGLHYTRYYWGVAIPDVPGSPIAAPRSEPPGMAAEAQNAPTEPSSIILASAVSASLAAILLGVYVYPLAKFYGAQALTLVPGYAKLRKSELLNHKSRDGLLQLIREEPGISPPELHGRVGGGWSTVVYHLTVLEKNQLVSSLIDGRHKRFFPTEAIDWSRRGSLAALRNARTKALYQLIEEDPGAIQAHLARRLGVSVAATQWHLERLQRAELVGGERRGRKVHYFPVGPQPAAPTPKEAVEVA